MRELIEKVLVLATEELKSANKKFPMFSSVHEAHSVLLEEIEEATEELNFIKTESDIIWGYIRNNNKKAIHSHVKSLELDAARLAAEAIQISAMARKFIDSEVCE